MDTIHHQGLRLALGAFRTPPVQSLYSEAQEPSLYDRRKKLSFFRKYVSLCRSKTIIFCWIPGHINIRGNEMADQEAKDALNMDIANVKIPFTDKKQQINEFIMS